MTSFVSFDDDCEQEIDEEIELFDSPPQDLFSDDFIMGSWEEEKEDEVCVGNEINNVETLHKTNPNPEPSVLGNGSIDESFNFITTTCHSEQPTQFNDSKTSQGVVNHTKSSNEKNSHITTSPSSQPIERMKLNDTKAGMEGLDKEKINRIIHEASKGSKYYENEKLKEKRMNEKIERMKLELERFTEFDKERAINASSRVLEQLRRNCLNFSRTLVHIDMDAFYAAVEMRDDPKLKDVPMAVGDNSMLCTSNYLARKFGVRAAMPGFIAKKLCPDLIIVPTHFDKYREVSAEIRDIFKEYDPNFSPVSLDEAYLDLTEYLQNNWWKYEQESLNSVKPTNIEQYQPKQTKLQENVQQQQRTHRNIQQKRQYCERQLSKTTLSELVVAEIRDKIFQRTHLTSSAGIAPNLMLAKICSDFNKPNGQYFLKPDIDTVQTFMLELPIRKVTGIGRVTEQMLKTLDIVHCKDILERKHLLYLLFSETSFDYFMRVALGISSNRITHEERKSMSVERTFANESNKEKLLAICKSLCEELAKDLKKESLFVRNVTLKYKLSSFVTRTRSKTIAFSIASADQLFSFAKELLITEMKQCEANKFELRLMGVRGAHFHRPSGKKQNTVESFFVNSKRIADLTTCNTKTSVDISKSISCDSIVSCHNSNSVEGYSKNSSGESTIHPKPFTSKSFKNCISIESQPTIENRCTFQSDKYLNSSQKSSDKVECPVCGILQSNETASLNAHIDSCLTRQTIQEIVREQDRTNKPTRNPSQKEFSIKNTVVIEKYPSTKNTGKRKLNENNRNSPAKKKTLMSFWKDK